jgi:hypothetical protein
MPHTQDPLEVDPLASGYPCQPLKLIAIYASASLSTHHNLPILSKVALRIAKDVMAEGLKPGDKPYLRDLFVEIRNDAGNGFRDVIDRAAKECDLPCGICADVVNSPAWT